MDAVDVAHHPNSKISWVISSVLNLKICKILQNLSINTKQLIHLKIYKIYGAF